MNILVTGGAGFIGSHIADSFLSAGHHVVILDNLSSGKRENINPKATFIEGDIRDGELVEKIFHENAIDVVDHHAAQIDVRKSVTDPSNDANINILGSLNLLEASRRHNIKRFIFASTGGAIYGEQDYFPADELHPTRPESPYGITKRSVELYLHYYNKVHGLDHTIFRYTNVYGPRQDPHGEAGVVAIFSNALLAGKQAMIFGDGKQTRDYVFISDLVRAHLLAIENESGSNTYNIATGIETDVNTLFTILANEAGKESTPRYDEARPGELLRSVCTSEKIAKALGWQPETNITEGLSRTFDFFRKKA
ncbi:MAG TPA: NAD-dependent epimerase/dehydratase family protein [Candidatus Kapabacteria bacterium]